MVEALEPSHQHNHNTHEMDWRRRREEEEDEIDELLVFDEDLEEMATGAYLFSEESSSRRRRAPDAPPRQVIHRDHAMGDARIRADYFGPNPVYTDYQFRRRYGQIFHVFIFSFH